MQSCDVEPVFLSNREDTTAATLDRDDPRFALLRPTTPFTIREKA